MASGEKMVKLGAPACLAALVVFAWANAHAGEGEAHRHREFDGKDAAPAALDAVDRAHRHAKVALTKSLAGIAKPRAIPPDDTGHHAGLKSCFSSRERTLALPRALPDALRGRTIYVVSASGGTTVPKILGGDVAADAEILVVEARSLADVAALAKAIGRPVSLASAEVARALGVECRDAKVTVSKDGKTVAVEEAHP